MIYVFDTNIFIIIGHYYPNQFPSFWERLKKYINEEKITSTREVLNELKNRNEKEFMVEFINDYKHIFTIPTSGELSFVSEIFKIPHYQQIVHEKQRLKGTPVADPFVIAAAKVKSGCVVTQESFKENAARIPNICNHFGIDCIDMEEFMHREQWTF